METTAVIESPVNFLNHEHTLASWLLTKDHKRIGILYFVVVSFAFALGGRESGRLREIRNSYGNHRGHRITRQFPQPRAHARLVAADEGPQADRHPVFR